MNLTLPEVRALVGEIVREAPLFPEAEMVILPPFTALAEASRLVRGSAVGLGAQNVYWEDAGAFTGEVSAPMLSEAGCTYVVIGHSERRRLFGETDATVNKRILAALRAGLRPIVCVGETLAEREGGRTMFVVSSQLEGGLAGLTGDQFRRLLLAYEPVWAIGTGLTATPEQAEEVHAALRLRLEEKYGNEAAGCAIILYGGSVKPANSYALFRERDIDGFLVGGASLEAASFLGITKEAVNANKEVK
jgi:triosephosphate isomerase